MVNRMSADGEQSRKICNFHVIHLGRVACRRMCLLESSSDASAKDNLALRARPSISTRTEKTSYLRRDRAAIRVTSPVREKRFTSRVNIANEKHHGEPNTQKSIRAKEVRGGSGECSQRQCCWKKLFQNTWSCHVELESQLLLFFQRINVLSNSAQNNEVISGTGNTHKHTKHHSKVVCTHLLLQEQHLLVLQIE